MPRSRRRQSRKPSRRRSPKRSRHSPRRYRSPHRRSRCRYRGTYPACWNYNCISIGNTQVCTNSTTNSTMLANLHTDHDIIANIREKGRVELEGMGQLNEGKFTKLFSPTDVNSAKNVFRMLSSDGKTITGNELSMLVPFRVLVTCHPRPFETHWQHKVITSEVARLNNNRNVVYETVDILKGGTHEYNVLEWSEFHNKMKDTYDTVWLPDCGGLWHKLFEGEKELTADGVQTLVQIIRCQMHILKPGGRLYIGKILIDINLFVKKLRPHVVNEANGLEIKRFSLWGQNDLSYVVLTKRDD